MTKSLIISELYIILTALLALAISEKVCPTSKIPSPEDPNLCSECTLWCNERETLKQFLAGEKESSCVKYCLTPGSHELLNSADDVGSDITSGQQKKSLGLPLLAGVLIALLISAIGGIMGGYFYRRRQILNRNKPQQASPDRPLLPLQPLSPQQPQQVEENV